MLSKYKKKLWSVNSSCSIASSSVRGTNVTCLVLTRLAGVIFSALSKYPSAKVSFKASLPFFSLTLVLYFLICLSNLSKARSIAEYKSWPLDSALNVTFFVGIVTSTFWYVG